MKTLAIIPARGGSKRIPRKNIKMFYGKPILVYSLKNAEESKIFDHIHVSTEDSETYDTASMFGFRPLFYRNSSSASENAPIRDVLREVLEKFEKIGMYFNCVCLLSATAPLIDAQDLRDAFQQFSRSKMDYPLLAVAKYPVPIEWALRYDNGSSTLEPLNNDLFFSSSQGFQDRYYDIGSFAFFTRDQLFNNDIETKFIPFVMPLTKSIDIDNIDDWVAAEYLYKLKSNYDEHKF